MEIEGDNGEKINIPTAGRLKKIAGIEDTREQESFGGYSSNVFNLKYAPEKTAREKVSDETEAFIDCVKRLRGELGVETERALEIALSLVMIDRP